jgi:DNA polymerase-3 subunit delta'
MHLDEIAGHSRVRAGLKRAVAEAAAGLGTDGGARAVSHAYLFTGPTGVGKTAVALAFARDLLDAAGGPVGAQLHPDLWIEDTDAESISIETLRMVGRSGRGAAADPDASATGVSAKRGKGTAVTDKVLAALAPQPPPAQTLQAFLSLRGLHSSRRVAVMARAERLKETAAAPLLKTIEEPPAGAVIILCAEAAELLPATIRSRCHQLEFQRLSDADVAAFLAGREVSLDVDTLRLARGCPGRALRLAADPESAGRGAEWGALLEGIPGGGWLEVIGAAARFGGPDSRKNRVLAREALEVWEFRLRDLAARRAGASALTADPTPIDTSEPTVWDDVSLGALLSLWESAREAGDRVQNNVNPRMCIEVFLADVAAGEATAERDAAGFLTAARMQSVALP